MGRLSTRMIRLFRKNKTCMTVLGTTLIIFYLHYELEALNIIKKHKPKEEHLDHHDHHEEKRKHLSLQAEGDHFMIDDKKFNIYSGELHYFRVHPEYWEQRLSQLTAAGLNTVSTYIPWNFHEEQEGEYNFKDWRDIRKFIKTAEKCGLHVMIRVGPYICGEWEWGGLPAWLLNKPSLRIRSTQDDFITATKKWFHHLVSEIQDLQHTHSGPIIAVQVENEYGVYEQDPAYMPTLRHILTEAGITELLYTCDDTNGLQSGTPLDGALQTINMQEDPQNTVAALRIHQPDRPVLIAEYWTGWFDWWGEKHHDLGFPWKNRFSLDRFVGTTKELIELDANFNLFMFHGGTNFGFWNGGIVQGKKGHFVPDTTSYDYDALVSESGELKPKYFRFQQIMKGALKLQKLPKALPLPETKAYGELSVTSCINLGQLMAAAGPPILADSPIPMEKIGNGYGYAVYETSTWGGGRQILKLTDRVIRDRALVFIDAKQVGLIEPKSTQLEFVSPSSEKHTLSFLVENQGRVNWAAPGDKGRLDNQRKGIIGDVEINGKILEKWKMWSLSFNQTHIAAMLGQKEWWGTKCDNPLLPGILKAQFTIKDEPRDTFIQLPDWDKGVIIVNGFNIGRYWSIGPQKTYYIPAPLLKVGTNVILIFEERKRGTKIILTDKHIIGLDKSNLYNQFTPSS